MTFAEQCAVVDRFYAAVMAGDWDRIRGCYHPDLEIWHNNDGSVDGIAESIPRIQGMHHRARDVRYEEIRQAELADGRLLQQHVLRLTAPDGRRLEVPTAIVVSFANGRIRRIEAYLDPAPLAALG